MKKIKIDDEQSYYELNSEAILGQGSFGKVYEGYKIIMENGQQLNRIRVAAKAIDVEQIEKKQMKKNLQNEILILKKLKSKYIVEVLDVTLTKKNVYIFLEFCQGDLRKLLNQKGRLTQIEALNYLKQIVEGYTLLKENDIIHRDIKPENVLLDMQDIAKLSDFGLSKILTSKGLQETMTQGVGTPKYKSLEMIQNQKNYDYKIDIWSIGITLYEMIFGVTPWTGNNLPELNYNITNKSLSFDQNVHCDESIKDLIRRMLDKDPQSRISFQELKQHPFIAEGSSKYIQEKINNIKSDNSMDEEEKNKQIYTLYTEKSKLAANKSELIDSFQGIKSDEIQQNNQQVVNNNNNIGITNANGQNQRNLNQQTFVNNGQQMNNNMQVQFQLQQQFLQQQQQYLNNQAYQQQMGQVIPNYQFFDNQIIQQIQKIDKYFTTIRIVSFFYNSVAGQILINKELLQNDLNVDELTIAKTVYLLLKTFFLKHRELLLILLGQQQINLNFNVLVMQQFMKSQNYNTLIQLVQLDLEQVRQQFLNILQKLTKICQQDEFMQVLDPDLNKQDMQVFNKIFQKTLENFIQQCQQTINDSQLENVKDVYKIILLCKYALFPEKVFDFNEEKEFDFYSFDQQIMNYTLQDFMNKIKNF